ncbi:OLC1v1033188C2 [Oldenlandia corymbosa var. corymbosa]|uniref:OLC1v1033188C2 n=1 Tax=Oldenlandia corymbosa var. corymbosa TaxID=529605 RepID=A0AAV1CQE5_OLDCO|nr:OLC1v1033188C2 [Oldenlandia corymbosa var. corymbosa]
MVVQFYSSQVELLLKSYMLEDSSVLYTSVIGGISACKIVYDLSQGISPVYFKSYSKLSNPQKIEWNNRVISTFHAIFITLMSLYLVFWSELFSDGPPTNFIFRRSMLSSFALGVSVGYFISDLAMIIWFYPSLGGMEYVVHHLLSMISVMYSLLTGEGQLYTFGVLISEATTPAINLRWYLDTAGMKNSKSYIINGVVMFCSWLVARILLFVYLFYHIWAHYDKVKQLQPFGHFLILAVPSVLAIMNSIWFSKIVKGLKKTLAKRR